MPSPLPCPWPANQPRRGTPRLPTLGSAGGELFVGLHMREASQCGGGGMGRAKRAAAGLACQGLLRHGAEGREGITHTHTRRQNIARGCCRLGRLFILRGVGKQPVRKEPAGKSSGGRRGAAALPQPCTASPREEARAGTCQTVSAALPGAHGAPRVAAKVLLGHAKHGKGGGVGQAATGCRKRSLHLPQP